MLGSRAPSDARRPLVAPTRQPIPRSLTSPFPPLKEIPGAVAGTLVKAPGFIAHWTLVAAKWSGMALWIAVTDRERTRAALTDIWAMTKEELHHYWVGSKLFVAEVSTSSSLVRKVGRGETLTWRERQQLRRTMGDLLRMVPFAILVIVPFAEFSLPVLLKLFPNMLPSQFEKKEYRQEVYKKSVRPRVASETGSVSHR